MPREWPPVSVWLLVGWLLTAPATLLLVVGTTELPLLLLVFGYGLAASPMLLRGHSLGFALAVAQAAVTGVAAVGFLAVAGLNAA